MQEKGMLGNSETLRSIWSGPFGDILFQLNGKNGTEVLEQLKLFSRHEPCWLPKPDKRFGKPLEVFYLRVPDNYEPSKRLREFRKSAAGKRLERIRFETRLNDHEFKATHQLEAGKTYTVKLIPLRTQVDLKDAISYVETSGALLTGPQGLSLVYESHRDRIPLMLNMVSLNKFDDLPSGSGQPLAYDGKIWPILAIWPDDKRDSFFCSRGDGDVLSNHVVLVCFFDENYSYTNNPDHDYGD